MARTEYAIIGGGITGASIAYHLSLKTDATITVFERQSLLSETTYKSMAGFGLYGDETQYRMKTYALGLYNEFMSEPRGNPRYSLHGQLRLATTQSGDETLRAAVVDDAGPLEGTNLATGLERDYVEYIEGDEIKNRVFVPHLNDDSVFGGVYRPRVWYLNPSEIGFEFVERARENGVTFMQNTRVTDIQVTNNQVTGLTLDDGSEIETNEVICAAGPWNLKVSELVGLELPMKHTLAPWMLLEPDPPITYVLPRIDTQELPYKIYQQPARGSQGIYLVYNPGSYQKAGDIYDPDTFGESIPRDIRDGLMGLVEQIMPSLLDAPCVEEMVGIRSVTPDRNPIVGWTEIEGFSIAAFNTSGIQLAPMVGKVISEQLVDGNPTELYDSLSISRFSGYDD